MKLADILYAMEIREDYMTSQQIQEIGNHHYRNLVADIKTGDAKRISLHIACINYMKDKAPYIQWAGQQGVMNGWLTVTDTNEYAVRPDAIGAK